ncbi:MAG TPA: hypothetical protein ENF65_00630 [Euryarchaeota archaeon]|nr:hypothetical protein [Euryarchaeota archaeon]
MVFFMSDFENFMRKEVYDKAAVAGSKLCSKGVDKSTVNNMISVFNSEEDPESACLLLITYIKRQVGRGEIHREAGGTLVRDLYEIYSSFREMGKEDLRSALYKYLVLSKWVFESGIRREVKKFEELLS